MRTAATCALILALAGCGGRGTAPDTDRITKFSSGPINTACLRSDRDARNRQLCGCIQTAANMSLTPREQRRAATLFRDPPAAQDLRMSESPRDSEFWDRYRAFAGLSERACKGY